MSTEYKKELAHCAKIIKAAAKAIKASEATGNKDATLEAVTKANNMLCSVECRVQPEAVREDLEAQVKALYVAREAALETFWAGRDAALRTLTAKNRAAKPRPGSWEFELALSRGH